MTKRSVRELGGEIWAELRVGIPDEEVSWQAKNRVVEIAMRVLARHVGSAIDSDEGLDVLPLSQHDGEESVQ